jgi:hypothetical protein
MSIITVKNLDLWYNTTQALKKLILKLKKNYYRPYRAFRMW